MGEFTSSQAPGPLRSGPNLWGWVTAAALGFMCGFLVFDSTSGAERLRAEVGRLQAELVKAKLRNTTRRPAPPPPGTSRPQFSVSARTNAEPSAVSKAAVSKEDIAALRSLQDRAARGEYVSLFDSPTRRKSTEAINHDIAWQNASNNAVDLEQVFAGFGLAPDARQQLRQHLLKIDEAVGEASMGIGQLLTARYDYDQKLRTLLSDGDYAAYRAYEAAKPAQREYALVEDYARRQGFPLDPSYRKVVMSAIQQAQAYTQISWYGPYNSVPQPVSGREPTIAFAEQQAQQFSSYARDIAQVAGSAGAPEPYQTVLAGYYDDQAQQRRQLVERLKVPFDPVAMHNQRLRWLQGQGQSQP